MPARVARKSQKAPRGAEAKDHRRHQHPAALRRFSELFESASDIIVINDADGWIVAANRAARDFGGYSAAEFAHGVHLRDVLAADEYEAAMIVTRQALEGLPIPEVYEREAVLRDGSQRSLELRSNVLRHRGRPFALQTIGRDITERKDAAAFQASLLQISQALLTTSHLDAIGSVICEAARRTLRVDGVYLWLRQGAELVGCAASGEWEEQFVGLHRSIAASPIGQMYRSAEVLVVPDFPHSLYAAEQTDWESAQGQAVQALLAVPLRRAEPAVGVLIVIDRANPHRFNRVLCDRAVIFGAQATVAIEAALAREREEEEGQVSAALLRVARAIRESLEEGEVLPRIARGARQLLDCDWAVVALWDARRQSFRIAATDALAAAVEEDLRVLEFGPGLRAVDTLRARETVEISGTREGGFFRRWGFTSMLAVPMVRSGSVVGVLASGYTRPHGGFTARERRIAEGVAAQAAVAVVNARLLEDLRRANDLKSEFLSTMSHELRTPISAILGYAELMHDGAMGPVSGEQVQVLERMLLNGRALLELVNMTLDVNRLEAGRIVPSPIAFDLGDLLVELRTEFAVRAAQRPAVALRWPNESLSLPLFTDHGKLKSVLRNLVDNALKFTAAGEVQVVVRHNTDHGRVYVAVRDSGPGIPESARTTIFDMFRQIDGTRASSRAGVGLGLYLVRRYAELLGGHVSVDSAMGRGSIFTVEIPEHIHAGGEAD